MPPARLFPSGDGQRLHMHTLGGELHASHRQPSLDYEAFLAVTAALTRDLRQVEKAVRRMAFKSSRTTATIMSATSCS